MFAALLLRMRVGPAHWNLIATTAFAGITACGIPQDFSFTGDGGDEETSQSSGDDGNDTYDDYCDQIDDPALRCSCGAELDPSIRCSYDDDWGDGDGDGDGDWDCDPVNCRFPLDCSPDSASCVPSPEIQDCLPARQVEAIPLEELPLGRLDVVRREIGTPDELIIVTADYFGHRVEGALIEHARVPGASEPVDTFVADIDDDGRTEVLIAGSGAEVHEIDLGTLVETPQWFEATAITQGALEFDGPLRFVTTLGGLLTLRNDNFETQQVSPEEEDWQYGAVDRATAFTGDGIPLVTSIVDTGTGVNLLAVREGPNDDVAWEYLETAHLAETMSASVGRLTNDAAQQIAVASASEDVGTKLKLLRDQDFNLDFHGMLPGSLTKRPPAFQRHPGLSRVLLVGEGEAAVVFVDDETGFACQQAIPEIHDAVSIDFHGDGEDELVVQYLDGSIAELVIE